jgi:serine protease AprX
MRTDCQQEGNMYTESNGHPSAGSLPDPRAMQPVRVATPATTGPLNEPPRTAGRRFAGRLRNIPAAICGAVLLTCSPALFAATLGPGISSWLRNTTADSVYPQTVIVSFDGGALPADIATQLQALGIDKGYTLPRLGMVAITATAGQIDALNKNADVRSIWPNEQLHYFDYFGRVLGGVDRLRSDTAITQLHNGSPDLGQGVTVVVDDSGCDASHGDLANAIIGNYLVATDTETQAGLTPLTVVPGGLNDDTVGHGTHVAGIIAGSGEKSGGLYQGVAPGAHLICMGSGAGLFVLNALGGMEWTIANQATYNIRVESNSWGATGAYSADDPVNIASKLMAERNIVVLFAAGNSGPAQDTMNPYAMAPWVIGVGAGTLEGTLASFSSAGVAAGVPAGLQNGPTIVAPGTGNAFAGDADEFSSDIVSTRDLIGVLPPLDAPQDADDIPTAFLPFYTEMSGTSMATPYAAGVVALMLSADPTLSVADVQSILRKTATRMPGYADWQVGAGYVNAWAAVDAVYHGNKSYGTFVSPVFNQKIDESIAASSPFDIQYEPIPSTDPSMTFQVQDGMELLDILGTVNDVTGQLGGNTVALVATDPDGNTYATPIVLPVIDSPNVEVRVPNPVPGTWKLRVAGVCGLAAVPQACLPSPGAALPGSVSGTINQWNYALAPVPTDIVNSPDRSEIEYALFNRLMDTFADGLFHPDHSVTRLEFANTLALDTPLRQRLSNDTRPFGDVLASDMPLVEAVTYDGDVLRDWNFSQGPLLAPVSLHLFAPNDPLTRLQLAIALVRALGKQAEAEALVGTVVTADYHGQKIPVSDNFQIPPADAGYVQIALDDGILNAFFTLSQGPNDFAPAITAKVKPNAGMHRDFLAYSLAHFNQHFATGK